jgi:hypothetical protein
VPLAATGGSLPYTWSATDLPPGLQLDPETGELSGSPSEQGTFTFTVQVQDTAGATGTASLSLSVGPAPPPVITTDTLPDGTLDAEYSATLTATSGVPPYAWSVADGSLPPGLALDAFTGAISGSPDDTGEFSFTARVTDARGASDLRSFKLVVQSGID